MPKPATLPDAPRQQHRRLIFTLILLCAVAASYLGLVIVARVERIFFPGNPISVPGGSAISRVLPGIDVSGDTSSDARINILLIGADNDFGAAGKQSGLEHTDSIEVVSVDPKTKSATALGIPRDLWVTIPDRSGGTYQDRVNTPLVMGIVKHYPEGGIGLEKEVIENNLHITIDHYVMINFDGFIKVIDALGGIDVDVPTEVYDPYYSETELPGDYKPQHFYPGIQHMDGQKALDYSRIRFSSDDLDRIQRQQRVMFATIAKAGSIRALSNAVSLWRQYKDLVQTDISDLQIPGYALLAKQVESNVRAYSLGPYTAGYTTPEGADVLIGNWQAIGHLVDSLFSDQASSPAAAGTPAPVLVQVENGAGETGLAAHIVAFLASQGYARSALSAADAFDQRLHAKSEIIDTDGTHEQQAYLLANWLRIPASSVRKATIAEQPGVAKTGAQLVVLLGTDEDFTTLATTPAAGG